ncbi:MAG: flagellar hook-associated protein FlgL [bacterium]|nr:flagellar hook-associated protein FlgL [bacterium]
MRIATSSLYENQSSSIDNLYATYQQQGQQLSTGKSLNVPSDDPTVIAQDIAVRSDGTVTAQVGKNLNDLNNQLTAVDGSLSSLTNILQSARSLAIEGASDTVAPNQRAAIAAQVDQLLQEAVGLANTQYAGKYVFAGTAIPTSGGLVQSSGSPITGVTSQGNIVQQKQQLPNGQTVSTGVTLQQAFNYGAPDGSPDVFQTLINLRDTLQKGSVVDQSQQALNLAGTVISTTTTLAQLSAGATPQLLATPLVPDSSGNVTINIANGVNQSGVNVTLLPTDTVATMLTKINTAANPLGISATFNAQTQKLAFSSTSNPPSTFEINDVPSAGATNSGNFLAAFGLTQQADVTNDLSTQIGDVDHVLQVALNARAVIGSTIQGVQSLSTQVNSQALNDTTVQSGLEDTDIAKVTSQFSQTQTVLQAAYATTSRLEAKTLFDYIQ